MLPTIPDSLNLSCPPFTPFITIPPFINFILLCAVQSSLFIQYLRVRLRYNFCKFPNSYNSVTIWYPKINLSRLFCSTNLELDMLILVFDKLNNYVEQDLKFNLQLCRLMTIFKALWIPRKQTSDKYKKVYFYDKFMVDHSFKAYL